MTDIRQIVFEAIDQHTFVHRGKCECGEHLDEDPRFWKAHLAEAIAIDLVAAGAPSSLNPKCPQCDGPPVPDKHIRGETLLSEPVPGGGRDVTIRTHCCGRVKKVRVRDA